MSGLKKKSEPFNQIQSNLESNISKYHLLTAQPNFYPSSARVQVGSQKKPFESYQPSRKNSTSNLTSGINKIGLQSRQFQKQSRKESVKKISSSKHKLKQIIQTSFLKIQDKKHYELYELDRIHRKIRESRPELGNMPPQQLLQIKLKTKAQKNQVKQKSNVNSNEQYETKIRKLQQQNEKKNMQVRDLRQELYSMMKIMDSNKELLGRLGQQIKFKTQTHERTQKQLLECRQTVKKLADENENLQIQKNGNVIKIKQIETKVQKLEQERETNQQKQSDLDLLRLQLEKANKIIQEKHQKQIEMIKIVKECQQKSKKCVDEALKGLQIEKNNLTNISMSLISKNEQYEMRNKILEEKYVSLAERESELLSLVMKMQQNEQGLINKIGYLQKTMDQTQKSQIIGRSQYFENKFFECEQIKNQLIQFEKQIKEKGQDSIGAQQSIELNKKLQSLMNQFQLRVEQMEKNLNLSHPKKQTI